MIYALGGMNQAQLSARISVERQTCLMFSLAQRRYIVTLVDRAMQEDGISLIRVAENLPVSTHSVCRWRAALQDTPNPPGRDIV
jgi:hypothetical protein